MPPSDPIAESLHAAVSDLAGSTMLSKRDRVRSEIRHSIRLARWAGVVARDWYVITAIRSVGHTVVEMKQIEYRDGCALVAAREGR